jgi:hypothetical protein
VATNTTTNAHQSDARALLLIVKYCRQEAKRLRINPTVIQYLHMASEELGKSVPETLAAGRVGQRLH